VPFAYPLTEAQQRIADLGDELAERLGQNLAPHERDWSFAAENLDALHRAGYLRLALPREYGGEDADVFDMVITQERLARGDPASALVVGMTLNIIGRLRDELTWPREVYAEVCREIAAKGGGVNTCATEADLGSVSRGGIPAATATPAPGGWRISGKKIFVTGAPGLRYFVTLVQLPPSAPAPNGEVGGAIVAADAPGLHLQDAWRGALSLRTVGNYDVTYEDVFVRDDWVVERRPIPGPAERVAPKPPTGKGAPGLGPWSLTIAAVYLGVGSAACRAAADYANARIPSSFGKPIAEAPHVQQWIGQMEIGIDAARAQLFETARLWRDHPELRDELAPQIAAAKYLCTNAACAASEIGLRVAGGFSLTPELSLERHFRDARAGLFQPPQDDLTLALVGRNALAAARVVHTRASVPETSKGEQAA
jgi:alkylation response protein AidB-like acyl-CoA dehydrogenase